MKILAFALTLISLNAMAADKTVLNCTTQGDALSSVEIVSGTTNKILVHNMDDTTDVYKLNVSLKNIIRGDSDTLVAAKDFDNAFGGAISDALLIRVLPGQKDARMAAKGAVFFLTCTK